MPTSATRRASSSRAATRRRRARCRSRTSSLGAELAGLAKDRDEYLQKQAEAQFAVPEGELVEAVRKVLARHGSATKH